MEGKRKNVLQKKTTGMWKKGKKQKGKGTYRSILVSVLYLLVTTTSIEKDTIS